MFQTEYRTVSGEVKRVDFASVSEALMMAQGAADITERPARVLHKPQGILDLFPKEVAVCRPHSHA